MWELPQGMRRLWSAPGVHGPPDLGKQEAGCSWSVGPTLPPQRPQVSLGSTGSLLSSLNHSCPWAPLLGAGAVWGTAWSQDGQILQLDPGGRPSLGDGVDTLGWGWAEIRDGPQDPGAPLGGDERIPAKQWTRQDPVRAGLWPSGCPTRWLRTPRAHPLSLCGRCCLPGSFMGPSGRGAMRALTHVGGGAGKRPAGPRMLRTLDTRGCESLLREKRQSEAHEGDVSREPRAGARPQRGRRGGIGDRRGAAETEAGVKAGQHATPTAPPRGKTGRLSPPSSPARHTPRPRPQAPPLAPAQAPQALRRCPGAARRDPAPE